MPIGTQTFDWEVELAAVIGKRARNVTPEDALEPCRRLHRRHRFVRARLSTGARAFYKLDWVAGKATDTCCPLGPRLVPAAAIANPQNIAPETIGERRDQAERKTDRMIFSIAEQISIALAKS